MKELKMDELEKVSGGMGQEATKKVSCPVCFEVFEVPVKKHSATCPSCGKNITVK